MMTFQTQAALGSAARTRAKICGITRPEDAQVAAACGADAIGLVFYEQSPRSVSLEQARAICRVVPPFVSLVALFVNAEAGRVQEVMAALPVSLLQFHGSEPAEYCAGFARPYLKSIAVRDDMTPQTIMAAYADAAGFLLDAHLPDIHGGGGVTFDWSRFPARAEQPLVLAGGLTPDNVAAAITQLQPYAVDVSSGVEQSKGIKSAEKIAAFMKGVRDGNASRASTRQR